MPARRSLPILRLAGKVSSRRRPVNSALGCVSRKVRVYSLRRNQQPSGASALLGEPMTPRLAKHRLREQGAPNAALRGWHPGHTEAKPHSQFHGRAAHGRTTSLARRRAGGAGRQNPRSAAKAHVLRATGQHRCESSASSPALAFQRSLTGRSTGAPTAWHLAREAQPAYPPPRGQGATPSSPG